MRAESRHRFCASCCRDGGGAASGSTCKVEAKRLPLQGHVLDGRGSPEATARARISGALGQSARAPALSAASAASEGWERKTPG